MSDDETQIPLSRKLLPPVAFPVSFQLQTNMQQDSPDVQTTVTNSTILLQQPTKNIDDKALNTTNVQISTPLNTSIQPTTPSTVPVAASSASNVFIDLYSNKIYNKDTVHNTDIVDLVQNQSNVDDIIAVNDTTNTKTTSTFHSYPFSTFINEPNDTTTLQSNGLHAYNSYDYSTLVDSTGYIHTASSGYGQLQSKEHPSDDENTTTTSSSSSSTNNTNTNTNSTTQHQAGFTSTSSTQDINIINDETNLPETQTVLPASVIPSNPDDILSDIKKGDTTKSNDTTIDVFNKYKVEDDCIGINATTTTTTNTTNISNNSDININNTITDTNGTKRTTIESEEEYNFSQQPQHACAYCGIHGIDEVVHCCVCGKWFCNSKGLTTASHIIVHLVRSKHNVISQHPQSPLGNTILECYCCGSRNIFQLGFISAKADNVVVIQCRTPCLQNPYVKDMPWDQTRWVPQISERQQISWQVATPTQNEQIRARPQPSSLIARQEQLWKSKPNAKLEDLKDISNTTTVEPARIEYESSEQYASILLPLVMIEADNDRRMKEMQSQSGISVTWEVSKQTNTILANFFFYVHEEAAFHLQPGDEVTLMREVDLTRERWVGIGTVLKISPEGRVILYLTSGSHTAPIDQQHGYEARQTWKSTTYDRMRQAQITFTNKPQLMSKKLYSQILGGVIDNDNDNNNNNNIIGQEEYIPPSDLRAPKLPPQNPSQTAAVLAAIERPQTLIQGPPGTGKTSTSSTIVYHLYRKYRQTIQVCAPSNVAVDHLAEKQYQTGQKVVRLASRTREAVSSSVDFMSLHVLLGKQMETPGTEQYTLHKQELSQDQTPLKDVSRKRLITQKRTMERAIQRKADVICCTCATAGDIRQQGMIFKYVQVDEAMQATEPECLIPQLYNSEQVVLVGDHCQLGPIVMCEEASKAGYGRSLFERLIQLGNQPQRQKVQYRMHPSLSIFPSNTFYEGMQQNGVSVEDRKQPELEYFKWPNPDIPMFFQADTGAEEYSASGISFLNRPEAVVVEQIVEAQIQSGVRSHQIGIITPYEGQRLHLMSRFSRHPTLSPSTSDKLREQEIASVDSFQGREKDFIILSCVRSNENFDVGFLVDPRRLNVALTRARFGLIILGNPKVLSKHPQWYSLLIHFKLLDLLVEGNINSQRTSNIILSYPRRNVAKKTLRVPVGYSTNNTTIQNYEKKNYNNNDLSSSSSDIWNNGENTTDNEVSSSNSLSYKKSVEQNEINDSIVYNTNATRTTNTTNT